MGIWNIIADAPQADFTCDVRSGFHEGIEFQYAGAFLLSMIVTSATPHPLLPVVLLI